MFYVDVNVVVTARPRLLPW